ncbi:MAG: hypothetical protein K9K78_03960, partial [Spirochaetales bacterium]|nr:hypothetical protein [Spirochaetales bacterium]
EQLTAHPVSPLVYSRNSARNTADVQQLHRYGIPEIDDLVTDFSSAGYVGNPGFSAGADPHYSSESPKGHETSEKSESTENSETSGKSDGQLSLF